MKPFPGIAACVVASILIFVVEASAGPAFASDAPSSRKDGARPQKPLTYQERLALRSGLISGPTTRLHGQQYTASPLSVATAVGTNYQVSPADSHVYSETAATFNPNIHSNIVSGSNDIVYPSVNDPVGAYRSADSGSTWSTSYPPLYVPSTDRGSDPGLAYDSLGNVFYTYLNVTTNGTTNTPQLVIAKSSDQGQSWSSTPNLIDGPGDTPDKPLMAIDTTGGQHNNRIYVAWSQFLQASTPIELAASDDGAHWTNAQVYNGALNQGAAPAVDASGAVYVAWNDESSGTVRIAKSTDGGATVGASTTIANLTTGSGVVLANFSSSSCTGGARKLHSFPSIDVDRTNGPFRGYLYAAWADGGTQGRRMAIYFSRSTDGGTSWSTPSLIDTGNTLDAWEPTIAVDQSNGHVTMAWYDRRDSTDPTVFNYLYRAYYTQSTDGGSSFLPQQIAVSTSQSDPTIDCNGTGDYLQLVAVDGVAHPFWADTRNIVNGNHIDQIFTAPVQDSAPINTWLQQNPANPPGARQRAAMAPGPNGTLVAFGGDQGCFACANNETWVWNGSVWTKPTVTNPPQARTGAMLVYNPVTATDILFGGAATTTQRCGQANMYGDTWSWNGTTWSLLTSRGPSGRWGAAMQYDAATGNVILFGGQNYPSCRPTWLGDTWKLTGSTWTQVTKLSSAPSCRNEPGSSYDAVRGTVVIFGGLGSSNCTNTVALTVFNDTWTWNGTKWTLQHPATSPAWRYAPAMAYDAFTSTSILFSGVVTDSTFHAINPFPPDTWSWDGSNWSQLSPANNPPGREEAAFAYHAGTRLLVLFGGVPYSGSDFGDTWTY
jgi:Galactose oxidase, central domain